MYYRRCKAKANLAKGFENIIRAQVSIVFYRSWYSKARGQIYFVMFCDVLILSSGIFLKRKKKEEDK